MIKEEENKLKKMDEAAKTKATATEKEIGKTLGAAAKLAESSMTAAGDSAKAAGDSAAKAAKDTAEADAEAQKATA